HLIKDSGVKVGVALNPATSLSSLDYILDDIDMVCLMLINPGFAGNKNEKQISYATKKIHDLKHMIENKHTETSIQVDGRVSLAATADLIEDGTDNLVLRSTGLFIKGNSLAENKERLLNTLNKTKK